MKSWSPQLGNLTTEGVQDLPENKYQKVISQALPKTATLRLEDHQLPDNVTQKLEGQSLLEYIISSPQDQDLQENIILSPEDQALPKIIILDQEGQALPENITLKPTGQAHQGNRVLKPNQELIENISLKPEDIAKTTLKPDHVLPESILKLLEGRLLPEKVILKQEDLVLLKSITRIAKGRTFHLKVYP